MSFPRHRITAAGVLFGLAIASTGTAAFLTANNLLFLIFSAMLALLLVSGFLNRLVLSGLELELLLPPHVCARTPAPARIRLRNLKHFTASFSIELSERGGGASLARPVYFPLVAGRSVVEAPIELTFKRRGRHRENVFTLSSGFPFGFIRRSTYVQLKRETVVYPAIEWSAFTQRSPDTDDAATTRAQPAMGQDFYRIRPYLTTDSARLVDWKSTAHTGELQIREFARDRQDRAEIYLDRYVGAGAASDAFERMLERCASAVWHLAERDVEILFQSDDFESAELFSILRYLALTEPSPVACAFRQNSSQMMLFNV